MSWRALSGKAKGGDARAGAQGGVTEFEAWDGRFSSLSNFFFFWCLSPDSVKALSTLPVR